MILLLLACQTPVWTETAAMAGHRARLDQDQDGRVEAAEYDKTVWNGPPFASADRDLDGDLSPAELATLVQSQSPSSFDGPHLENPVKAEEGGMTAPPRAQQDVAEVLAWMCGALDSVGVATPAAAALDLAIQSARLDSVETQAILEEIRPRWLAQGWSWPQGLP
jgi:hypothetical protein